MDFKTLYLTTDGRISRKSLILGYLPLIAIGIIAALADHIIDSKVLLSYGIFQLVFMAITIWPSICLSVKRFHDRNRPGWMFLLGFVPLVNIWVSIELLFLRGTSGDNRFGPDSLVQNKPSIEPRTA